MTWKEVANEFGIYEIEEKWLIQPLSILHICDEILQLREALAFYADTANWRGNIAGVVGKEFVPGSLTHSFVPDCGRRARRALGKTR